MFGANLFADHVFAGLPKLVHTPRGWQIACKEADVFTVQDKADSPFIVQSNTSTSWDVVEIDKYTVTSCKE